MSDTAQTANGDIKDKQLATPSSSTSSNSAAGNSKKISSFTSRSLSSASETTPLKAGEGRK